MKFYRLKNKDMPWYDYGDILLSGNTARLERLHGKLQYERTGPFQPEITISGIDDLLVTDSTKRNLEASGLKGFQFQPVVKRHISLLDWTTWDLQNESPAIYPDKGIPENYILSLPHSQETAEKMEEVWEVLAQVGGTFVDGRTYKHGGKDIDIMCTDNSGWFLVTEKAKSWLEAHCGNWIEFWDLEDLPY